MIRLAIDFDVSEGNRAAFEAMYRDTYIPAVHAQPGFAGSTLMRAYPPAAQSEIGGTFPEFNYRITLDFDAEQSRLDWAASPQHDPAWQAAIALARRHAHTGYDVVA